MTYEEKTISTEMIYQGAILNLRKDKVFVKGDKVSFREIIEHRGGVAIAAVTGENKMLMVRQYRKAAEQVVLEVPAGKREAEEDDPMLTGMRELKEETGYSAKKFTYLTSFYSSIGYSTEMIYLYMATDLTPGETNFDENEAIDICEYDISVLKNMVIDGKIIDGKSITAILLVAARLGI